MMATLDDMRREYSASKLYWALILLAQLALFTLSGISTVVGSGRAAIIIGVVVFTIPPLTFALKRKADGHYDCGEALRRAHLLEESLGLHSGTVDRLFVAADRTNLPVIDSKVVGSYFASEQQPGLQRLVESVEESAFYTRSIARATSVTCGVVALVGVFLSIVILWLSLQLPIAKSSTSVVEAAIRLFPQLFGFFAVGVFAELWSSYRSLSKKSEQLVRECEALQKEPLNEVGIFRTVSSYDCALAKTPPLPGTIKSMLNSRLRAAWSQEKSHRQYSKEV